VTEIVFWALWFLGIAGLVFVTARWAYWKGRLDESGYFLERAKEWERLIVAYREHVNRILREREEPPA
jgi:hypothetical protein